MISEFHLRGWQRMPDVEIVALGHRTISRAEARRDQCAPEARVYDDLVEGFCEREREFVDCILEGRQPTQSGRRNLRTLGATFAACEAAARGTTLKLDAFGGDGGWGGPTLDVPPAGQTERRR